MKPIVEVRNLSKKYKIGERQRYLSLRDSVSNIFSRKNTEGSEFWALDDVSFDIQVGESIGIIGRNGAGKSTLLKILSRITLPTKGSVILRGRMASLLEVGTGFHSELTGRENVFMNGSILGLKKREIEAKFDEIVDFSGVEQFIDTPLKHYSSGMQLRLAFAVAAHLEPEILVIDEVLAVGDAEFQKRCLGKMDEVSRSGRTVLFVSHNLGALQELCPKSIYLNSGKIVSMGRSVDMINQYLKIWNDNEPSEWKPIENQIIKNEYFTPSYFALIDKNYQVLKTEVPNNEPIGILIKSQIDIIHSALTIGIGVYTLKGDLLFWAYQTDSLLNSITISKGLNEWVAWLPAHLLNEGEYLIELIGGIHNQFWICEPRKNAPILKLTIKGELSNSPYWVSARPGFLAPHIKFESFKHEYS
jgi:lipopolysaccharide transport system ATP-binding protein